MQNWMIQQVKVNGVYFNGPGPAASVNVTFYFDSANFPGAVVSGGTFNSLSMSDTAAPDQLFQILGCTVATTPIAISGTVSYCSNPSPGPVPNVALTLSGSASGMSSSNASGNYLFSVPSGGSYTVMPAKAARTPGSANINTVDVIATQRHFLNLGPPLSGCRLTAADVNGDSLVNTVDVVAMQRFFLGLSTGVANVGKYQFTP